MGWPPQRRADRLHRGVCISRFWVRLTDERQFSEHTGARYRAVGWVEVGHSSGRDRYRPIVSGGSIYLLRLQTDGCLGGMRGYVVGTA
ncbi:MAG: hypothetical protein OXC62_16280 [Aestuariivita sp.]|nr:hypothetical protein [Aestuariivita sp.]